MISRNIENDIKENAWNQSSETRNSAVLSIEKQL